MPDIHSIRIKIEHGTGAWTTGTLIVTLWHNATVYQYSITAPQSNVTYEAFSNETPTLSAQPTTSTDCDIVAVMLELADFNAVMIDKIALYTSPDVWYGIDSICRDTLQPDPLFFLDDGVCDSGYYHYKQIAIDLDSPLDFSPYKQLIYFDMYRPNQFILNALLVNGNAIDTSDCPLLPTSKSPTYVPSQNPSTPPSLSPSHNPSISPSAPPSGSPTTDNPTIVIYTDPTIVPSFSNSPSLQYLTGYPAETTPASDTSHATEPWYTDTYLMMIVMITSIGLIVFLACILGVIVYVYRSSKWKKNRQTVQTQVIEIQKEVQATVFRYCAHGCSAYQDSNGKYYGHNADQCPNNNGGSHNYQPVQQTPQVMEIMQCPKSVKIAAGEEMYGSVEKMYDNEGHKNTTFNAQLIMHGSVKMTQKDANINGKHDKLRITKEEDKLREKMYANTSNVIPNDA
eukprot:659028_1